MAEQRGAAAEPTPVHAPATPAKAPHTPRMPAAFATALAGAALIVGTVIAIVVIVAAVTAG